MNWFKSLFMKIGSFFKTVATTAIGIAANDIGPFVIEIVQEIHDTQNMDGSQKRDMAVGMIKTKYPDIQTAAINLAIETAWAIISDKVSK